MKLVRMGFCPSSRGVSYLAHHLISPLHPHHPPPLFLLRGIAPSTTSSPLSQAVFGSPVLPSFCPRHLPHLPLQLYQPLLSRIRRHLPHLALQPRHPLPVSLCGRILPVYHMFTHIEGWIQQLTGPQSSVVNSLISSFSLTSRSLCPFAFSSWNSVTHFFEASVHISCSSFASRFLCLSAMRPP